jgi:hypothetical protein
MDWKRAKDRVVTIATAVDPTVTIQRYRDCLRSINARFIPIWSSCLWRGYSSPSALAISLASEQGE